MNLLKLLTDRLIFGVYGSQNLILGVDPPTRMKKVIFTVTNLPFAVASSYLKHRSEPKRYPSFLCLGMGYLPALGERHGLNCPHRSENPLADIDTASISPCRRASKGLLNLTTLRSSNKHPRQLLAIHVGLNLGSCNPALYRG